MNRTIKTILRPIPDAGCRTFACRFHLGVAFTCLVALTLLPASRSVAQDGAPDQESASTPDVTKGLVLEWVDQLDASKASQRRAAEKRLIAGGLPVLEFLPETRVGFSIEATERLARVRTALMSLKAEEQSKQVRIRMGKIKTIGEALEAISKETQVEFEHSADESLPFQASDAPLSFWHAVDLVLDQANLDVNQYGGDRETIQLVPRSEDRLSRVDSAAYSGVYRLEPTSVSARRVFNQPGQNSMNVSMEITWQPGLTPIGLTIPIDQLSGKLDDGREVEPQTTEKTIDIAANNELGFSEFYLPLELPAESPRKIESLRGTIESLLPGKRQEFVLDLTDPGVSKTIDAVTVSLERVERNGALHEVRFVVELENADRALESHRQWIFQNPVFVRDQDGNRIENLGYQLFRQNESSVGMGYLFEIEKLQGASLVYESPTSVVRNKVDFVLQDIKLP